MPALPGPRRGLLVGLAAATLLMACATEPQVRAASAPAAELARYRTFAFLDPAAAEPAHDTSLLTQRMRSSARAALERQGYRYSERDPDLRVQLRIVIDTRPEIRSQGFARRWPYAPDITTYRHGTLAVDLVDARKRAVVWQGVAQGRLDESANADPGRTAEHAVGQIFAAFPQAATATN
jgi:hypothetical protein